jgi:hypothetical protein
MHSARLEKLSNNSVTNDNVIYRQLTYDTILIIHVVLGERAKGKGERLECPILYPFTFSLSPTLTSLISS